MKEEITFELTNYCPHMCKFCSTDATNNIKKATFLDMDKIIEILEREKYKHIILSGGEPLSHPEFYSILELCKKKCDDVIVYSNAISHIIYNPHVIDGIYLEANLTVTPETDKIHILRRVKQGKEETRPEVHLSRNHTEECSCNHKVIRPDGHIGAKPCNKWKYENGEEEIKPKKIITLVGPTKFEQAYHKMNKELTLAGHVVLSCGVFDYKDPNKEKKRDLLEAIHKKKIDMADEIVVINVDGFINKHTQEEIEYAEKMNKPIRYLEEDIKMLDE